MVLSAHCPTRVAEVEIPPRGSSTSSKVTIEHTHERPTSAIIGLDDVGDLGTSERGEFKVKPCLDCPTMGDILEQWVSDSEVQLLASDGHCLEVTRHSPRHTIVRAIEEV